MVDQGQAGIDGGANPLPVKAGRVGHRVHRVGVEGLHIDELVDEAKDEGLG